MHDSQVTAFKEKLLHPQSLGSSQSARRSGIRPTSRQGTLAEQKLSVQLLD